MECHLQRLQGRQGHEYEVKIPTIQELPLVSTCERINVRQGACCFVHAPQLQTDQSSQLLWAPLPQNTKVKISHQNLPSLSAMETFFYKDVSAWLRRVAKLQWIVSRLVIRWRWLNWWVCNKRCINLYEDFEYMSIVTSIINKILCNTRLYFCHPKIFCNAISSCK